MRQSALLSRPVTRAHGPLLHVPRILLAVAGELLIAGARKKKIELHTFSSNNPIDLDAELRGLPQIATMAPKEPFKVHSLSKHIEETTKGLNANARSKKAAARPTIKKAAAASAASIFDNNNDSESDSSSSSSSDDSDSGPAFLRDLTKPKASKRRSKDDEIADSDVERTSAASRSKPAKKAAAPAKAKVVASSDDTSSDADSESSDEEVNSKGATLKSKAASTSAGSPTSSSGSDSGSGSSSSSEASSSDDEAESESESEAAPAKTAAAVKKPTGKAAPTKQPESDSDDSSPEESDSESEEESQPAARKPAVDGAKAKSATKAARPTESEDGSDESNEESSDEDEADESMHIAERAQASQVSLPQLLPPDFELRKGDQQSNGQDVARVCSEANLQGKQLWYFTLPVNVPVSVVENLEFPMDASQQGGSVFSHNGEDYGIAFDSTPPVKSIQILIPSADGSTYQPCKMTFQQSIDWNTLLINCPAHRTVDEVMQIRRITQIGATTATPVSAGSSTQVARPQPKGLKARFQPIGVNSDMGSLGPESDDEDDVEMVDAPTGPTPKASQKKDRRRKDAAQAKESASKSKKNKRRHSVSEDEDAAAAEQLMEESVSAVTKSKKQKTAASRGSPDLGSEPALPAFKQTFVVPPAIPNSSATADVASTPAKKTKTSRSTTKPATPLASSQVSGGGKKETPVPVPTVPSLGKSAASTDTPAEKKTKKRKGKAAATGSPV